MTAVRLRGATAADVRPLAELGRDSFVAKFGEMYRPEDLAAFLEETHSPEAVAAELANPARRYRLAELDGPLAGGISGGLAGYCKLAVPSTLAAHDTALRPVEIKQLYTAPGLTGHGIGAALTDWALSEARAEGADAVQLSVWSGNAGAQRFYARYGFVKVADIAFRVGEQIDEEFLFALRL